MLLLFLFILNNFKNIVLRQCYRYCNLNSRYDIAMSVNLNHNT